MMVLSKNGLADTPNTTLVNLYTHSSEFSFIISIHPVKLEKHHGLSRLCNHKKCLFHICNKGDSVRSELNEEVKNKLLEFGSLV